MNKLDVAEMDGMTLLIPIYNRQARGQLLDRMISSGIVRCVSPERDIICDNPATHVFYQDDMEYYPCCEKHRIYMGQWSGSTRFTPYVMEVIVIKDKAEK